MAINTRSKFIYGHQITSLNNFINFREGAGPELTATLPEGSYALSDFVNVVANALNTASSTVEFTVSVDRLTQLITISGDNAFDLLVQTGNNAGNSTYPLLGFTGADRVGLQSYEGDSISGRQYLPQFPLNAFVNFDDDVDIIDAAVKTSADSITEVVSYGAVNFLTCNIKYITDVEMASNAPIENNPNGVADFRDFRDYIIRKRNIEIVLDRDSTDFVKAFLESTPDKRDGTGLRLKELNLRGKGPANYFESGPLKFRKVN
jgi:hypothetical protein